ncbi:hypothetical protein [Geodermatophilus sp. URMC 63]
MTWIEVTRDEQRLARIEALACRSAGLPIDPLVLAIAKAEVYDDPWRAAPQDEEEPTTDISTAMNRGLIGVLEDRPEPGAEWRRELQPAGRRSWLSKLFGR